MSVGKFSQNYESRRGQKLSLANYFENPETTNSVTVISQICRNGHEEMCCKKSYDVVKRKHYSCQKPEGSKKKKKQH